MYAIAVWSTGTFEANFGEIDIEGQFKIPPSTLLLEAMRRFDEESVSTMPIPTMETPDGAVLDLSLVVLNVVGSYALNHLHPSLIQRRFEEVRSELEGQHPILGLFKVTDEGAVTVSVPELGAVDDDKLIRGVSIWVDAIFQLLDGALAWRFSSNRLARLLAPWYEQLDQHGFLENLGVGETEEETEEESHLVDGMVDSPVPVGCLVLDGGGVVQTLSIYGPRIGRISPAFVTGKVLGEVLPSDRRSIDGASRKRSARTRAGRGRP